MADFSVQKVVASLVNGLEDKDNQRKYEKQVKLSPPAFYNQLLGAHLGRTSDTAATRAE